MGKGSVLKEVNDMSIEKEKTHQDAIGWTGFPGRPHGFL